jgi:hypothetical protein
MFVAVSAFAGGKKDKPAAATPAAVPRSGAVSLDEALKEMATAFTSALPQGKSVAITRVDAPSSSVSDFIIDTTLSYLGQERINLIDRQHLADLEIEYNINDSGAVDDEAQKWRGHQGAPDIIITGKLTPFDNQYQLTLSATEVESARIVLVRTSRVMIDNLNTDMNSAITQAISDLGRNITQKTSVSVGRISYGNTGSVSELSDYLRGAIESEAVNQPQFQVTTTSQSDVVIEGSYTRLVGEGVQVRLNLRRGGDIVRTSRFTITGAELAPLRLSDIPPNTTDAEYAKKREMLEQYGENGTNAYGLTITLDHPNGIYYDDDYMTFTLSASNECYFKIQQLDVNGVVQVVYPRRSSDNALIHAGETIRFPLSSSTRYHLVQPFGEEYILVEAYDLPFVISQGGAVVATSDSISQRMQVQTKGFDVQEDEDQAGTNIGTVNLSPAATAKINYSILRKQ